MQVFSVGDVAAGDKNPFTPKAFLNRYWDKEITNGLPKPLFLFSKASPLSTMEAATFAKLASGKVLSTRLPEFCSAANLFCFPEVAQSLEKHARRWCKFQGLQRQEFHQLRNESTRWTRLIQKLLWRRGERFSSLQPKLCRPWRNFHQLRYKRQRRRSKLSHLWHWSHRRQRWVQAIHNWNQRSKRSFYFLLQ